MNKCKDDEEHSVDFYYLKAMHLLRCADPQNEHPCACGSCEDNGSTDSCGIDPSKQDGKSCGGRGSSWSLSEEQDYESGAISQLPDVEGKVSNSRLNNRRFSDGVLLHQNTKVSCCRVHWADDCRKELARCNPRRKYIRNPAIKQTPMKSILKNSSDESLIISKRSTGSDNG